MKNMSKKLIYVEEYVPINGINQYLFHSGTNLENPVMLFLHTPFKINGKIFLQLFIGTNVEL
ncbi:hypothetical protein V7087_28005 [Neobacillus niacini]|uniref:hypothetical protein n=1 Tax=Neobacillus niacini TaxID=86668 RepID=UPI003000D20E